MLENNMIAETTADTLMGYAYMQMGVEKVTLTLNIEEIKAGKEPHFVYSLKLQKKLSRKYNKLKARVQREQTGQGGLFNKLMILWLLRQGSPGFMSIENNLLSLCRGILPDHYKVDINVE